MAVRGIVFDKDGTLFDFQATWGSWAKIVLSELETFANLTSVEMAEKIQFDWVAGKFLPTSPVIAGTSGEVVDLLHPFMRTMPRHELMAFLDSRAAQAQVQEAVPLVAFIESLQQRGLKTGVATNDSERAARSNLAQANVEGMFDFIAGYDSGHGGKPGPGMCLAFANAMELAPETCVMVGDSTHDLLAGRAAGMVTVGVLTGPAERDELVSFADVVLPDIGHLLEWIDALT
jgi:phosphoglycolate phosphatase